MAKRSSPQSAPAYEAFVFEILGFAPSYLYSVNHLKCRDTAFSEHLTFELRARCVFPQKLAGREVSISLAAERKALTPAAFEEDEDWIPNCVGALEMSPARNEFYTTIPHEGAAAVASLIAAGSLRFAVLYGPPLKRGKTLCSSMQLLNSVNLDDY